MKRMIILFCLIATVQKAFPQKLNIDSIIRDIAVSKNDSNTLLLIESFYGPEFKNNPVYVIEIGLKLLKQSQTDKSVTGESSAYSILGHGYRLLEIM